MERFWKLENPGEDDGLSQEDRAAVNVWKSSAKMEDGHYHLDIPFRNNPPKLMNNRQMAERRLQCLGRKLTKDPDLHGRYTKEIDTLLEKGYAERCNDSDDHEAEKQPIWYLPHHNVYNPKKPDKTRIVFDCAAEYKGVSLNKEVLQGPDFTNNLVGVLLRFRMHPIAIMADIEGMFNQVRVYKHH